MLWLSKVYIIPAGCHDESWYQLKHGLTTNDPGEMQTMLNKLRKYAEKKGFTGERGQVGGGSF